MDMNCFKYNLRDLNITLVIVKGNTDLKAKTIYLETQNNWLDENQLRKNSQWVFL